MVWDCKSRTAQGSFLCRYKEMNVNIVIEIFSSFCHDFCFLRAKIAPKLILLFFIPPHSALLRAGYKY